MPTWLTVVCIVVSTLAPCAALLLLWWHVDTQWRHTQDALDHLHKIHTDHCFDIERLRTRLAALDGEDTRDGELDGNHPGIRQ